MADKIPVTAEGLRSLAGVARVNGKTEDFVQVALQWADEASKEIERLRALAQGEPGEASAWQKLFWDVAKELNCLPSSFVDGNDHVIRAARKRSPTASAPAAEREPPAWPITWEVSWGELDEDDECSPCGWRVHDRRGGRNDREWTLIATGSTPFEAIRAAHGIGTKEPTNADQA